MYCVLFNVIITIIINTYCTGNAVARVIAIIKEQGPHLGLFIKDSKCELFSKCNLNSFPLQMKKFNTANLVFWGLQSET